MTKSKSTARRIAIQTPDDRQAVVEIKKPVAYLGDLAVDAVPDYLEHLAVVARMIAGFALYDGRQGNLERAIVVIAMACDDLGTARDDVVKALADCVAEAGRE